MIISANEARRLLRTKWQTELFMLDKLIKEAVFEDKNCLVYNNTLTTTAVEYLQNQGYTVLQTNDVYLISWSE